MKSARFSIPGVLRSAAGFEDIECAAARHVASTRTREG